MMMPEATINENNCMILGKNNVWPSRKRFYVDPVSESLRKQIFSDYNLRFGVRAPNVRHVFMPNFWCVIVSHD